MMMVTTNWSRIAENDCLRHNLASALNFYPSLSLILSAEEIQALDPAHSFVSSGETVRIIQPSKNEPFYFRRVYQKHIAVYIGHM